MSFYLIKNKPVIFGECSNGTTRTGNCPVDLTHTNEERNVNQQLISEDIVTLVGSKFPLLADTSKWNADLTLHVPPFDLSCKESTVISKLVIEGNFLTALELSVKYLAVKVTLNDFQIMHPTQTKRFVIESNYSQTMNEKVSFPKSFHRHWANNQLRFGGILSIEANLNDPGSPSPQTISSSTLTEPLHINTKILNEEIACDVVIVTSEGTEVKCNKCFLIPHSSVLKAMLESDFSESKTGRIEMPDATAKGVKAMLAFLYYWDTETASSDFSVALELIKAGHKYDIASLEESMRQIILSKNNDCVEVDDAIKLFHFALGIDIGDNSADELKQKALEILKANVADLDNSKLYHDMFSSDTEFAKELFKLSLSN